MTYEHVRVVNVNPYNVIPLKNTDPLPVLVEGLELIDKHKLNAVIGGGTLLGFYRDNGFIPHDTDVDVDLFVDIPDYQDKIIQMIRDFEANGFLLIRTQTYKNDKPMQIAFIKNNVIFDIYLYYPICHDYLNLNEHGLLFYPFNFSIEHKTFSIFNRDFIIPKDIESYLSMRYGSWKIPTSDKKSWEKDAGSLLLEL